MVEGKKYEVAVSSQTQYVAEQSDEESGRFSSIRNSLVAGSFSAAAAENWRAASIPVGVSEYTFPRRISPARGTMVRRTSPIGAQ